VRHFTLCIPASRIGSPVFPAVEASSPGVYVVLHRWLTVVPETPKQVGPVVRCIASLAHRVEPEAPNQFVRYPGY